MAEGYPPGLREDTGSGYRVGPSVGTNKTRTSDVGKFLGKARVWVLGNSRVREPGRTVTRW